MKKGSFGSYLFTVPAFPLMAVQFALQTCARFTFNNFFFQFNAVYLNFIYIENLGKKYNNVILRKMQGKIIERIISSDNAGARKSIIYLGDGRGDYCPCLRLSKEDYVMPRDGYPLSRLISDNTDLVKGQVYSWSNGEELGTILSELINKLLGRELANNNLQNLSGECKLEAISASSEESYSVAIPVRR
jgi:Putative Phosphatase